MRLKSFYYCCWHSKLGWPPIRYNGVLLSKIICKALYKEDWPCYLKLELHKPVRDFRSFNELKHVVLAFSGTFQDHAANLFNSLTCRMKLARNYTDPSTFIRKCIFIKNYFFSTAKANLDLWWCVDMHTNCHTHSFFYVSHLLKLLLNCSLVNEHTRTTCVTLMNHNMGGKKIQTFNQRHATPRTSNTVGTARTFLVLDIERILVKTTYVAHLLFIIYIHGNIYIKNSF